MTEEKVVPFRPKLIRNQVPHFIRRDGLVPKTRIAGTAEFERLLREKLQEEVDEYLVSKDPAELADIQEVVLALGRLHSLNPTELEQLRRDKAAAKGTFSGRYVWLGNLPSIVTLDVVGGLL